MRAISFKMKIVFDAVLCQSILSIVLTLPILSMSEAVEERGVLLLLAGRLEAARGGTKSAKR